MRHLTAAMAAFLFTTCALGQIVECIDAKGGKTLAQFCPPGTVKEIKRGGSSSGGATPPAAAPAKSLAEQDAAFKKRALERQELEAKGEKEKADAKIAERNCNDARGQLRQLQDGARISRTDPNTGERIVLEEKDRPAETASAQKAVDTWCKK